MLPLFVHQFLWNFSFENKAYPFALTWIKCSHHCVAVLFTFSSTSLIKFTKVWHSLGESHLRKETMYNNFSILNSLSLSLFVFFLFVSDSTSNEIRLLLRAREIRLEEICNS